MNKVLIISVSALMLSLIANVTVSYATAGQEALQVCLKPLDRTDLERFLTQQRPELEVQKTPDGQSFAWRKRTLLCEASCAGTLSDKGFAGGLQHTCAGIGLNHTRMNVEY